jgi:hypothetical protein
MFMGETIATGAPDKCCGQVLKLEVLRSGAGYYVGTFCPECGPYSRESGYFRTREEAQTALDEGGYERHLQPNDDNVIVTIG